LVGHVDSPDAASVEQLQRPRLLRRRFSKFPPAVLAVEVHRTRELAGSPLRHPQNHRFRSDVRRVAGWLSALLGNLAYLLDDPAAEAHLRVAHGLGGAVGDRWLQGWTLGAQAMVANSGHRHTDALTLARRASEYADTPLRRAQLLAWGELRALAHFGHAHHAQARQIMAEAQDQIAADADGEQPGQFGFDLAELHLHLAEASLALGDPDRCRIHAEQSRAGLPADRPAWVAATLALACGEAARGHRSDAAVPARH
jgi:hypothetical protein